MRDFTLETRFALVLLPNNALCHLLTRADFEAWAACVRRHLLPAGRLAVEVFVPNPAFLLHLPDERYSFGDYEDPGGRGRVVITESAWYDPATQIRHIRTHYRFPDQREEESGELPMRMYFPQELDALFVYNGFVIERKYGGFDRRPFDANAATQLLILQAHHEPS
jgi:hypothetical protein